MIRALCKPLVIAVILATAPLSAVAAKPSLRDIPEIEEPLYAIAVAYEIGKVCPTLVGRELKGINMLRKLRTLANRLGYTDKEILAYVRSDAEKDRMRAKGMKALAMYGSTSDPQTYCAAGRAEMQKGSAIGALLREK